LTFQRPDTLLWLVVLVPLVVLSAAAVSRAAARRKLLLGGQARSLAGLFSSQRRWLRDALALVSLGLVIVSLSGPLVGTYRREIEERGVDVMVVLDTSRSMLAEDVQPSRLELAKRDVRGLLQRLHGHRMGLVTFAGDARRVIPLTSDGSTFGLFLDDVDTSSNWTGGTAIGEGLELALDAFDDEQSTVSVIILLTDGEDHDSDPPPTEVSYQALARGIPVHVVAYGTDEGGNIPIRTSRGGITLLRDKDNNLVTTRPDPKLLQDIASTSGGVYLSADRTPFPLDEIFEKRIAVMDGVTRASRQKEQGIDRYQWGLMLALLCLGTRQVLRDGRLER
jgi:Ca-activated chloride channel family protein